MNGDASDRAATHDELERVRLTIHELVAHASAAELRQPSAGTRWTNEQLLFHTVFGYMVVRALLPLVRMFGHLPDSASRVFARVLNATTPGFHVINYLGSCGGARVFHGSRLTARADRVIASLHRASLREDASRSTMQQGAHGATGLAPVAASDTQTVGVPATSSAAAWNSRYVRTVGPLSIAGSSGHFPTARTAWTTATGTATSCWWPPPMRGGRALVVARQPGVRAPHHRADPGSRAARVVHPVRRRALRPVHLDSGLPALHLPDPDLAHGQEETRPPSPAPRPRSRWTSGWSTSPGRCSRRRSGRQQGPGSRCHPR